jgi:hypothetical protein
LQRCGSGEEVLGVSCRVVGTHVFFAETDDLDVTCTVEEGLVCLNANQTGERKCEDYEAKFLCTGELSNRNDMMDMNGLCFD